MPIQNFDLVVIGGGPAGLSGALAAATFGKKVALVERADLLGGAGINTGTIPSKTLRESALVISGWRARKLLGVDVSVRHEAKLSEFMHHSHYVASAERERMVGQMQEKQVTRFQGVAKFEDAHTISVSASENSASEKSELRISGDNILIATGSSPLRPEGFMFEHPRIHDSNEILEIVELPRVLAVIGAGVIGAEYASTFAALGVETHLIDGRDRLLPFLDAEISAAISRGMETGGVKFHWNEKVLKCEVRGKDDIALILSSGHEIRATDVLVAAGRSSNTGQLNLSAAGLTAGERGLLVVDESYRTSVSHIYAAGDVVGAPALAGVSMEQARVAVCRAFDLSFKDIFTLHPGGIYTIPEAGMVGQTEENLRAAKIDYISGRADYSKNARGQIVGDEHGFLKLLFRSDDMKLLGVHVVGEQASELVHIGTMAMLCDGGAELFNKACFNYPTLGDLYKYAAYDAMLKKVRPSDSRQK